MKKLIISLSITLIIFSTLYFLIEENILQPENARIRNIIGKYIEKEYTGKTDLMEIGFKRFVSIAEKKLDYTTQKVQSEKLANKSGKREIASVLNQYITSDPYCKRIRIVNSSLEIVHSTSKNDLVGSVLSEDLYGEIFDSNREGMSRLIVDPILENIIYFSPLMGEQGDRYRILFYFAQGILDSIFMEIESLDYKGFLITTDKVLLINFPEIDVSDEENLARLVELISENDSGAVRISLRGFDKVIYYRQVTGDYSDWTIGLTVDAERLRISKVGAFILIMQALVVVSLVIFVFISIRQRRGPEVLVGVKVEEKETIAMEKAPLQPEITAGVEVKPSEAEAEAETEVPSLESGILSLSEVEEVTEVEEIGEAEVADEVEEAEGYEELAELSEPELVEEEVQPVGPTIEAETARDEEEEISEAESVEEIEGAYEELGAEKPVKGIIEVDEEEQYAPTVEEIERKAGEHGKIAFEFERATAIEEEVTGAPEEVTEAEEVEAIEDDLQTAVSGVGISATHLPELEKLVHAGFSIEEETSVEETPPSMEETPPMVEETPPSVEEAPPSIPEEVYKEKEKIQRDDELSHLISTIEESPLKKAFKDFLKKARIAKGAILIRDPDGRYSPSVIHGLSDESSTKLIFSGYEKIFRSIFQKGKMLYIVENPFYGEEMRSKFSGADIEEIDRLFFAPVFAHDEIRSIILIGMKKDIPLPDTEMIEKIKDIKKIIINIIE